MSSTDNQTPTTPPLAEANKPKTAHSKTFKWLVAVLVELIILIAVFSLGMRVGFRKANFTKSWASNYRQNFGLPINQAFMPPPPDDDKFFNAHGVFGNILSLDKTGLIIKDQDNDEKAVVILPTTTIRQNFQTLLPADLKVNEQVLILGAPNEQGQIEAKFIRVTN